MWREFFSLVNLKIKLLLTLAFLAIGFVSWGQASTHAYWIRYFNQLNFSSKWSWQNEIDERRSIQPHQQLQFIAHSYAGFKAGKKTDLMAGVTVSWVTNTQHLTVPEQRLHQAIVYSFAIGKKLEISGRLRAEERFFRNTTDDRTAVTDGYHFRFRSRYRLQFLIPLGNTGKWNARIADEIMYDTDANDAWSFDQNRAYASLEYSFSKPVSLEIGYMYFTARANNQDVASHIIRTTLYHRIFLNED